MKKIDVFGTGTLPYIQDKHFVSVSETTKFFDLNLNLVKELEGPYLLLATYQNLSVLKKGESYFKFDHDKMTIIDRYDFTKMGGPSNGYLHLIKQRDPNIIKLLDFRSNIMLWEKEFKSDTYFAYFSISNEIILATQKGYKLRYCLDIKNGNKIWELRPEELNLVIPISKLSRTYLFDNLVIGVSENREYYAINALDKSQIWTRKLPVKTKGQVVVNERFHHSISIVDFFKRERKVKYHEFIYIVMDFKTGDLVKEIDISEQLYLKGFLVGDGTEGPSFSQMAASESHIFFAIDNKLIAMEIETGDLEEIYEHDTKFYFSKYAHDMLFYTDDKFRCLVFKEEDLLV